MDGTNIKIEQMRSSNLYLVLDKKNCIFKMIRNPVQEIGQILILIVTHSVIKTEWLRGRELNLYSGDPDFKSRPDCRLDLFSVVPSSNPWPSL